MCRKLNIFNCFKFKFPEQTGNVDEEKMISMNKGSSVFINNENLDNHHSKHLNDKPHENSV